MSRFKILSEERQQLFIPFDIGAFFWGNCLESNTMENEHVNSLLYLNEGASQTLLQHIGWGTDTACNQVEQGGMLFGSVLMDKARGVLLGHVTHCSPAETEGSMKHLLFPHSAWKKVFQELDELTFLSSCEGQLTLLGWYHTHPKHLRVYMSEKDQKTQSSFFYQPWHFSIVLNPQQRIWRVFCGQQSLECKGYMMNTDNYV